MLMGARGTQDAVSTESAGTRFEDTGSLLGFECLVSKDTFEFLELIQINVLPHWIVITIIAAFLYRRRNGVEEMIWSVLLLDCFFRCLI